MSRGPRGTARARRLHGSERPHLPFRQGLSFRQRCDQHPRRKFHDINILCLRSSSLMAVPPGTYIILNYQTNTVLDLWGSGTADGTPINAGTPLGVPNQLWIVGASTPNGLTIQNYATGTFASAVQTHSPDPGFGTLQSLNNVGPPGSPGWLWYIEPGPMVGTYIVRSQHDTTRVLDVKDASSDSGTEVILQTATPNQMNQVWRFVVPTPPIPSAIPSGTYQFLNVATGTVLDLNAFSAADGTQIQGEANNNGSNQLWTVNSTSQGYTIQNLSTATYASIVQVATPYGGYTTVQGNRNPSYYIFKPAGVVNSFNILDATRNLVMDLYTGSANNGTPVIWAGEADYSTVKSTNQMWSVRVLQHHLKYNISSSSCYELNVVSLVKSSRLRCS